MNKRTGGMMLIVVAAGVVGIVLMQRGSSEAPAQAPSSGRAAPVVAVTTASTAPISEVLDLTGSVEPRRVARLGSPAEGPIVGVRVHEGDRVKSGALLLSIGRTEAADALLAALGEELAKEEDNLRRTRELVDQEIIPAERLDEARTARERARAQLMSAQEKVRDYAITAPWSGVVSHLLVAEGEFVGPRAALLEMYDPASLVVSTAVPEERAAAVETGMRVRVQLDAFPGQPLTGRIERVYPYLDPRLRTRTIQVKMDQVVGLLPGMFARLQVMLESVEEAVVVPMSAVVHRPQGPVIFVVENGRALERSVDTGIQAGTRVEVVAGVDSGDRVVVAGNGQLQSGVAVRVTEEERPGRATDDRSRTGTTPAPGAGAVDGAAAEGQEGGAGP